MDLLYKPDWDKVKERFKAWWDHEIIDRCCIQIFAPKKNIKPIEFLFSNNEGPVDFDELKKYNEHILNNTFYGGEAFPTWQTRVFPFTNSMAAFTGCPVELGENTGWVYPVIDSGELYEYDYHDIKIDTENYWYKLDDELHSFSAGNLSDALIKKVWLGASSGDTLAALRSTEKLLTDLMDCPGYVREFDQYLVKLSMDLYDKRYKEVYKDKDEGITDWFSLWAEKRYTTVQNDFAYMISADIFNNVFLPSIEMQTNFYDYSFYHCDGPGNFKHIDALCSLPKLGGIQVLPGEGKPSPLYYMDELRKVQAAGKNLHITIRPDEIQKALQLLSPKGLFICTYCSTEDEARFILDNMQKWSDGK